MMFSQKTIEAIGSYVYCLVDPRNEEIFYVGKGVENRVFAHVKDALAGKEVGKEVEVSQKFELIREIDKEGLKVKHYILRHGLSEEVALEVEAALIDCLGLDQLANEVKGHHCERGKISCEELEIKMAAEEAIIEDDVLVIKINQLYRRGMSEEEIYEATRKYWRLSKTNAKKIQYVLSAANGLVRGVFEPEEWYQDNRENKENSKRIFFEGKVATQAVCEKYLFKTLNKYPKTQGQNPAVYIFGAKGRTDQEVQSLTESVREEESLVEEEAKEENNDIINIDEKVITIKINQKYRERLSAEELYDATRYCWSLTLSRAQEANYVFAVANGEVKEIYENLMWYAVEDRRRVAFTGQVANEQIREKYIGKSVRNLYKQGEANPCKYFY